MPVDWLKLIHEGRLTDDGIKDKNVKKAGLYVAPELTVAWLLIKGKAVLSKRRPAQEREDMVYIWRATRKVRKGFSASTSSHDCTNRSQPLLETQKIPIQDCLWMGHLFCHPYE